MSAVEPLEISPCAFCARGDHHLCRPDVHPCGCADSGHPGRGEAPGSIKPVPPAHTEAEARERLNELRVDFIKSRDEQAARTLDWLLLTYTPMQVYEMVFAELSREAMRDAVRVLPPFQPHLLAPAGAHGIPRSHRGPRGLHVMGESI